MFERNRVDSFVNSGVPVEIRMLGEEGAVLTGKLMVAPGRNFSDAINSAGGFVEFEPWGGEREFIAKSQIHSLKPIQESKTQSLKGRLDMVDTFDPYGILGVPHGASFEDIKSAWHRLSKAYHPDRYASAELPVEVADYLSSMSRRINTAYATLEAPLTQSRKVAARRQEPIYTSRPRS